jgi:hypothetical protein
VDLRPRAGVDATANANALPFRDGQFSSVHSINPYGFQPVSMETARVMQPGGLLRVTGSPANKWAKPLSPSNARAAGFEVVETTPMIPEHVFGTQRVTNGRPIRHTGNETTTTYRRLP